MRRFLPALILLLLPCLPLLAVKARPGTVRFTQPDGRVVSFVVHGDEFGHYMSTPDGCAVALDAKTGALCYATYTSSGVKVSSGIPVGSAEATASLISASRNIPVEEISARAASRRLAMRSTLQDIPATRGEDASVVRTIVIPVNFSDVTLRCTVEDIKNLLMQEGYSQSGAAGSVRDYFEAQFALKKRFVFDVCNAVNLSKTAAYYGATDERGASALLEACNLADAEVDFSLYDHVYMFYAGGNPADGGADEHAAIWPHCWDLYSAGLTPPVLDGRRINNYSASSELMNSRSGLVMSGIGTFCHEFAHLLGLPDLYDTDGGKSGGTAEAYWSTLSLMDAGNYNDNTRTPAGFGALEMQLLGLLDEVPLPVGAQSLEPVSSSRRAFRFDAPTAGEYFLFECRTTTGWDKYIGGSGLLITHIDRSSSLAGYSETSRKVLTASERWSPEYAEINCRPDRQCADVVEAMSDPVSVTDVFFPHGSVNSFSPSTSPSFRFWSGEAAPLSLSSIKKSSGVVSFNVNGPVSLDLQDVFQDAAILNWHTEIEALGSLSATVRWEGAQGGGGEMEVSPYAPGCYAATIENLTPGESYTVTLSFLTDQGDFFPFTLKFATSPYGGLPYIYVGRSSRNSSGSNLNKLPLRVMNARGATSVSWSLDSEDIAVDADGYYRVVKSGELKARVRYSDGTEDIIIRYVSPK